MADAYYRGEKDVLPCLHDALIDDGHEALAEHFASVTEIHTGCSPGNGQCWALLLILGKLNPLRELLGTPTASEWVGLTPPQFRKLVQERNLEPADYYANRHYKSGPPCPLWDPEMIAALDPAIIDEFIQKRTRKKGKWKSR